MKKLAIMFAAAGMAILLGTSAWAAGRLNFMLVNLTDQDIVDAKIYPTYFPKYESENLLKSALDPDSRVYIGPNYYGEQNFWNIALKLANGHEQTFSKLRLTRYNTYTVYSTPEGLRIRQTYEPASARYEFGPEAPSYMGAEPDVSVKASAPEKLAEKPAAPSNMMAIRTSVETTRDGKVSTVSPTGDFRDGDKARMLFTTNRDGYIYWVAKNPDGGYRILFPTGSAGMANTVVHDKEYSVTLDPLRFNENQGTETIFAILSPKAVPDLDKAVRLEAEGKSAEASRLVSALVDDHEQKRTSNALVFEEVDDDAANTQSQLADGEDYPLVGSYELTRN